MSTPTPVQTLLTDVLLAGFPDVKAQMIRNELLGLAGNEYQLNAAVAGRAVVTTRKLTNRLIHIERRAWSIWRRPSMRLERVSVLTYCYEVIKSARPTSWVLDGHECEACRRLYRTDNGQEFPRVVVDI